MRPSSFIAGVSRVRKAGSPAKLAGGALAVLVGAALAAPNAVPAQSDPGPRKRAIREEITPELRLGVSRGFEALLARMDRKGELDATYPVAANALGGLAFLAGGYTDTTGPLAYAQALKRITTALLAKQNAKGYFDDGQSLMYGHGFATLYLAELYGTSGSRNAELREALERAVRVIEGSQSRSGGWDYGPAPDIHRLRGSRHGASDTSITVCQTMALRAARGLGIRVEETVIARARTYITEAQNGDGGFSYRNQLGSKYFRDSSAFPRSAAGVCILYSLGSYDTDAIRRGFDYVNRNYRWPWSNKFPYYAHYYCAQAMFQAGGSYWTEYFTWVRDRLLERQKPDGSWHAALLENDAQATAMSLIILQLPYRFLPIHER